MSERINADGQKSERSRKETEAGQKQDRSRPVYTHSRHVIGIQIAPTGNGHKRQQDMEVDQAAETDRNAGNRRILEAKDVNQLKTEKLGHRSW